ncbi:NPCBM/NEW2 domain-containing protein [Streptomyces sp. NPDC127595]|uniref:NPCBM/NEW2 domain-containing protein n=1 Tax=Streptomyces sp. NPDC127595 TaxID=3345405 RepID=UPI0036401F13
MERNTSNGGSAAGDGGPITLNGHTFAKGLGTFAPSEVSYYLGSRCSTLESTVGGKPAEARGHRRR